jgi:hypothetical protein
MADEIRDTRNAHTLFWSFPKRGEDDLPVKICHGPRKTAFTQPRR